MTTIENENLSGYLNGTDNENTRMTVTFLGKEQTGFDKFECTDEQPASLKTKMDLLKQHTNKSLEQQVICRICLSEE